MKVKVAFTLFCAVFIFSCTTNNTQNDIFHKEMSGLDNAIWCEDENNVTITTEAAFDSLLHFKNEKLSNENKAYFDLLYTIFGDKAYVEFKNDSIISNSLKWYSNSKDKYNYTRALLYKGIVLYRLNPKNTSAYTYFKEAEKVYEKFDIKDNYLAVFVYDYLALINLSSNNLIEAEKYFELEYDLCKKINWNYNYINILIKFCYLELSLRDYDHAKKLINEIISTKNIPEQLYNNVKSVEVAYLDVAEDYKSAIIGCYQYKVDDKSVEINKEYLLSMLFEKMNNIDSAAVHATKLVNLIANNSDFQNYDYYTLATRILYHNKEYTKAEMVFKSIEPLHYEEIDKIRDNKVLELEKKYDTALNKQKYLELKHRHNIIILSFIILVMSVIAMILGGIHMINRRKQRDKISLEMKNLKIREIEFLKLFTDTSLGLFPEFQEKVYLLIAKNHNTSCNLVADYNMLSSEIKKEYRKKLTSIFDNKIVESFNPVFHNLNEFSGNEKCLLFLSFLKSDTEFISKVLNTSESSVRGMKCRIKDKINVSKTLSESEKDELLAFLKSNVNSSER